MVVQLWSYGCTTIRVLVVQLQNSDFLKKSTHTDNSMISCQLRVLIINSIFSQKYFPCENSKELKEKRRKYIFIFYLLSLFNYSVSIE